MDAVKFLKEMGRICSAGCGGCQLKTVLGFGSCTNAVRAKKAEAVVAAVEKWSAEHPQKTYLTDFLEKHPDAPLSSDGEPDACARCCGYRKDCPGQSCRGCLECWNTPMEETK